MFKKSINFIILICCIMLYLTSCNNITKIEDLENETESIDTEISELKNKMNDWQDIYDDAKTTYNQYKNSSNSTVQNELQRTKYNE